MTVTFFGHRDAPRWIIIKLFLKIRYLIRKEKAYRFLVGNNGSYDRMVLSCLKILKVIYPKIEYQVVVAYEKHLGAKHHYLPFEIIKSSEVKRIVHRNFWLIKQSDYVISYIRRNGCANYFTGEAAKKGRKIFYL
jgi:uncharacterized phage-like protein YoqJ